MTKPTYWELLRDPRWQRKRLEIMERDEFTCRECGSASGTLNVHHGYYAKDRDPWEYEDETLVTLCEPCHEAAGVAIAEIRRLVGSLELFYLERVRGFAAVFSRFPHAPIAHEHPSFINGFSAGLRAHPHELEAATDAAGIVDVAAVRQEAHRKGLIVRAIEEVFGHLDGPALDGETAEQKAARDVALRRTLETLARRLVNPLPPEAT